jgi:hypothetical protein
MTAATPNISRRQAREKAPIESRLIINVQYQTTHTTLMLTTLFLLVLAGLIVSAANDLRHTRESSNYLVSNICEQC